MVAPTMRYPRIAGSASWRNSTTTATAEARRISATGRASCILESIYTFAYDESTTTSRARRRGAFPRARARGPRYRGRRGSRVEERPRRGVPASPPDDPRDEGARGRHGHGQVGTRGAQDRL